MVCDGPCSLGRLEAGFDRLAAFAAEIVPLLRMVRAAVRDLGHALHDPPEGHPRHELKDAVARQVGDAFDHDLAEEFVSLLLGAFGAVLVLHGNGDLSPDLHFWRLSRRLPRVGGHAHPRYSRFLRLRTADHNLPLRIRSLDLGFLGHDNPSFPRPILAREFYFVNGVPRAAGSG